MTDMFQNYTPAQRKAIQLFSNHPKVFGGANGYLLRTFGIPPNMWLAKRFLKLTAEETKDYHPFLPKPPRDLPLALTSPPFHLGTQQGTPSGSFQDIPSELLSLIFSFVSLRDFITFSTVSKHWYSVTLDDSLWRLQFIRAMNRCPSADWLHRLFDRLDASSSTNWRISFIRASKATRSYCPLIHISSKCRVLFGCGAKEEEWRISLLIGIFLKRISRSMEGLKFIRRISCAVKKSCIPVKIHLEISKRLEFDMFPPKLKPFEEKVTQSNSQFYILYLTCCEGIGRILYEGSNREIFALSLFNNNNGIHKWRDDEWNHQIGFVEHNIPVPIPRSHILNRITVKKAITWHFLTLITGIHVLLVFLI